MFAEKDVLYIVFASMHNSHSQMFSQVIEMHDLDDDWFCNECMQKI